MRRALALTIDRESLVKNVLRGGQLPAFCLTPPGTAGYTCRTQLHEDIAEAKRLLAEAGYPDGKGLPPIELLYNTLEAHRIIAESIQQMWKKNLGIEVHLVNQEWKVYLDSERTLNYQVCRASWIGDYVDPNTFLDMFVTGGGNNRTGWSNPEYDRLIAEAARTTDPQQRLEVFQKAEAILLDELPIIPIYFYTHVYARRPEVKGWYPTILDNHPYKYVYLESEQRTDCTEPCFVSLAKRFLEMIPVLFVIATLTFFMVRLAPGGPFTTEKSIPPEIQKKLEAFYGLNKPLYQQYLDYMGNLLKGDLGPSFKYATWSVNELIWSAFPVSLELGCYALAIALLLGLSAGIIASLRQNTATDHVPMSLAMIGICVPTFVMGPLLILVFGLTLGWVNASGWDSARDRILPSLTLGAFYAAYIARLARGGMLEILNQDFIRTARAKGASSARIVFKHALKGGLLPVVSFLGPAIAGLITGSFVVETIFQVPGLGRFFVTAAFNRDYTMVLGTVLFYAVLIILLNLVVDVVQVWLNPKLRFE